MKSFLLLASLCAVIIITNGNPFMASLEKFLEQEAGQRANVDQFIHEATKDEQVEIQNDEHTTEEIIAAAMCQADAALGQFVFAVGRKCSWPQKTSTCEEICASQTLKSQDEQIANSNMFCAAAYHVYGGRPVTKKDGEETTATLGLKTRREKCNHYSCGPNYCCCIAY